MKKPKTPSPLDSYGTNHNAFYEILLNEGVDTEYRYRGYNDKLLSKVCASCIFASMSAASRPCMLAMLILLDIRRSLKKDWSGRRLLSLM